MIKKMHRYFGWATWLLGKIVATFIVQIGMQDMIFRGWLFAMAGLAILLVIIEVIYRSQSRSIMFKWPFKRKNIHSKYHN
jgi:sulfite exporter TauE/SafE